MEENSIIIINRKRKFFNLFNKENFKIFFNIIKFLVFDIFVLLIFFVSNYKILFIFFLLNIILFLFLRLNLLKLLSYLVYILPLIIFTFIINVFIENISYACLIATRFIIACISTYIFSRTITVLEISKVIETILCPLKLLKFDTESVGLLVSISISFIPIIKDEMVELKEVLESKGYIMKISNIHIFIRPFIRSIFKRTNDIEKAIIAKGYTNI